MMSAKGVKRGTTRRAEMPETVFVYLVDKLDDGTRVFGAVCDLNDIPTDEDGAGVGTYRLEAVSKFTVTRNLE